MEDYILPDSVQKKMDENCPYRKSRYFGGKYDNFKNIFSFGFVEGKAFVAQNIIKNLKSKNWSNKDNRLFVAEVCDFPTLLTKEEITKQKEDIKEIWKEVIEMRERRFIASEEILNNFIKKLNETFYITRR